MDPTPGSKRTKTKCSFYRTTELKTIGNCYHDYVWYTIYGTKIGWPSMCAEVRTPLKWEKDKTEHSAGTVMYRKIVKISEDKLYAMWELFHSATRFFHTRSGHQSVYFSHGCGWPRAYQSKLVLCSRLSTKTTKLRWNRRIFLQPRWPPDYDPKSKLELIQKCALYSGQQPLLPSARNDASIVSCLCIVPFAAEQKQFTCMRWKEIKTESHKKR